MRGAELGRGRSSGDIEVEQDWRQDGALWNRRMDDETPGVLPIMATRRCATSKIVEQRSDLIVLTWRFR